MSILQPTSNTKMLSCKFWYWRGAMNGVGCQIRVAGIVHSSLVTRTKSPLKPNKSGL